MRLFAHHDVDGKIRSLTWFDAPEGVSIMLTPGPGELVAEIEGHKLTGKAPNEEALGQGSVRKQGCVRGQSFRQMAWRAVSDSCVTLSSSRNAVSFSSALNLF